MRNQRVSSGRGRREDPPVVIQAVLAVRWLVLAALISLEALTPGSTPTRFALPLYGVALLYSAAFTLYAWRYPDRAGDAARWALVCDSAVLWIGMHVTTFPREFLLLGFPLAVVAGILIGHAGATAVGVLLALSQNPSAHASIFAPNQWLAWTLMTFSLLAAGNAGAAVFERLANRARFADSLAEIKNIGTSAQNRADAAETALDAAVALFRADSGSLMLFDPQTEQLEVLAARGGDNAVDGSIAGWVAQGGHAILLTSSSMLPFRLQRQEIGSSLCVPVAVGRTKLGVLNLNRSTTVSQFTHEDLEAADVVAHHMAGLLMRALYERTFPALVAELAEGHSKVNSAFTRDPVVLWPVLLDLVRSLTAAQFAVLALEHEDTGNVEIVSARGIDGASAQDLRPALLAATTRREIHVSNGSGVTATSVTCVPLCVNARTIGAVGLGLRTDRPYPHSLLRAVAAHIAAAVDTALAAHRIADIGATEERRRVAREMHDGLAQTLADALLQTDLSTMTAQATSAALVTDLKDLRTLLERAMRELREFMSTLRRGESRPDRLFPALEMLAGELGRRRTDPPTTVVCIGNDANVSPAVRHAVLAIVRQALTNVHAHAQATSVTIRAEATDERCTVSIADNGLGFDLHAHRASVQPGHHLGLASMEERASLVGGRLEIDTAPNRGTTVTVDIEFGGDHG